VSEPQGPDGVAHLDLETISDLDEGLLTQADAEAARAHLAGCARCQDEQAALAAVREALAGDREIAMPDDVSERIFGALAELPPFAAAADAADGRGSAPLSAAVTTLPAPRRPGGANRATKPILVTLGAAATIALLVLGALTLPHGSSSSEKSSSAAGTSAAAGVPLTHSGRDYDTAGLGTEALALLPGGATSGVPGAGVPAAATSAAAASSAAATTTAAASAAGGGTQAATSGAASAASGQHPGATGATDRSSAAAAPTTVATGPKPDALAALRVDGAAQSCLMSYAPRSGTPLAIDFATLAGKPAVIGVFTDPDRSNRLQVVAVGPPDCSLYSFARPQKP
jgi:hypothetical protein